MNDYRILVVDDEEDLCEILKFNLENEGYEVDTANSAEEALTSGVNGYDLILLDIMMEGISGFKMARILRQDEKTANTPIIFLTAKDTENDMLTGFNLGADDYISKPFSIRQVIARVKAVLRRTSEKSKDKEIEIPNEEELKADYTSVEGLVMEKGSHIAVVVKNTEIGYWKAVKQGMNQAVIY